jgi:hypothetical protein
MYERLDFSFARFYYRIVMGYFRPEHRIAVRYGSSLAERVVCKELSWSVNGMYDVKTLAEFDADEPRGRVFAQLLRVEPVQTALPVHYRVCLRDREILEFMGENTDIDLVSFITFIMTHELLHIHRFSTGKADFFGESREEEVVVDALTRVFLAKNPVIGLKKVLSLLDKIAAAPLYNDHILKNDQRCVNAHL